MAKRKQTRKATATDGKGKSRPAKEPTHFDLVRAPDATAPATVRFSCGVFVRVTHPDYTPQAVRLTVPFGVVEKAPKTSRQEHRAMRGANRRRFGARGDEAVLPVLADPVVPLPAPSTPESEDATKASREW